VRKEGVVISRNTARVIFDQPERSCEWWSRRERWPYKALVIVRVLIYTRVTMGARCGAGWSGWSIGVDDQMMIAADDDATGHDVRFALHMYM